MNNDKNKILEAYSIYQNELSIISTITDYDYISVTEIAQLFNRILNINCLDARHINYLLLDNKVMKRTPKNNINSLNKFIVNKKCRHLCNEIQYKNTKFYIWDARFIFLLFGLTLSKKITRDMTLEFCKIVNRYTQKFFDIDKVFINLQYLMCIIYEQLNYT